MNDKQIMETFWNLKKYCTEHQKKLAYGESGVCCEDDCKFLREDENCQIIELAKNIRSMPCLWDVGKIERIINETN